MRVRSSYGSVLDDINQWTADAAKWQGPASSALATITDPKSGIEWIKVQTAYGPDILITEPLVPGGGPSDPIARFLKPKVTVKLRPLPNPLVLAPEGEPGDTKWPLVSAAGIFGGALGLILILRGILK